MRLCRFEKQKRYILNWDEDGMEKGEYICYDTDDTTAKLAFKSNLKKQTFRIHELLVNLARTIRQQTECSDTQKCIHLQELKSVCQ